MNTCRQTDRTEFTSKSKHSYTVTIQNIWTVDAHFSLILCVSQQYSITEKSNWVKEHVRLCAVIEYLFYCHSTDNQFSCVLGMSVRARVRVLVILLSLSFFFFCLFLSVIYWKDNINFVGRVLCVWIDEIDKTRKIMLFVAFLYM